MSEKIVTAKFRRNTLVSVDTRYQYDYGQILHFDGLTLPDIFEVHFSNDEVGESITQIGSYNDVEIPDQFFLTGDPVYAWVFVHDDSTDGRTKYLVRIDVKRRAEITDLEPTPQEQSAISQAIAAMNIAVDKANTALGNFPKIVDGMWYVYDAENEIWVNTEVKAEAVDGQDGFSPLVSTTPIQNGTRVTVVDIDSTKTFDVMNGSDGKDGKDGKDGQDGYTPVKGVDYSDGKDGFSPTATVAQNPTGATIVVTDANGTTSASVYNGLPGKDGEDGDDGFTPTIELTQESDGVEIQVENRDGIQTAFVHDGVDGLTPEISIEGEEGGYNIIVNGVPFFVPNAVDGEDGFSPVISTTQTGTGWEIEITDSNMTHTVDLYNGVDGVSPEITVDQIVGGHEITIVHDGGTDVIDVMDGQDGEPGEQGESGDDGITPTVDITPVTGGHNVAFSYGTGDSRNVDFDVMDGKGLTNSFKNALLECFRHVAWTDTNGSTLFAALEAAMGSTLLSITATYTQSGYVFDDASLDSLLTDLQVVASYSDGTSETIDNNDVVLNGTLSEGTSTITVTYFGKTDTFDVTVTRSALYFYDFTKSMTDYRQGTVATVLGGDLERTSSGLNFNAAGQAVHLPNAYAQGRTIEIDVGTFDLQGTTSYNTRFVMVGDTGTTSRTLLTWRHENTIGWSSYNGSWASEIYGNLTERNVFANSTVKIVISSSGYPTLYVNDTLIGTASIAFSATGSGIVLGTTAAVSSGGQLYNATITGVRVY